MINEQGETVCDKCGKVLTVGEHPFCPHGFGGNFRERDEIPGGITLENYGSQPVTFYSHSERRAYMAKHGLQEKERWAPFPGTDKDPMGIPNPAGYVDKYTLEQNALLIARNGQKASFDGVKSGVLVDLKTDVVLNTDKRFTDATD